MTVIGIWTTTIADGGKEAVVAVDAFMVPEDPTVGRFGGVLCLSGPLNDTGFKWTGGGSPQMQGYS